MRACLLLAAVLALAACAPADPPSAGSTGQPAQVRVRVPLVHETLVNGLVRRMTLGELAGQMIMVSIEQDESGDPVLQLGQAERTLLQLVKPGGVILFGGNLETADQVQRLTRDLQRETRVPLTIATDHEGGLVSRLTSSGLIGATVMPSATLVGIAAETLVNRGERDQAIELARGWGAVIGAELRALGFTMNMAPVADVAGTETPGLLASQRRTFGSEPVLVGELTAAAVEGLHSAGVTAVLKHFPGQGPATLDSHTSAVSLPTTLDTLRAVDMVPFFYGIRAGARAVMSAHISYPNATGNQLPATVSKELVTGLLRGELGFDGVVITDALNMDAVAAGRGSLDLVLSAIEAGADIMLKPLDPVRLHSALVDAANSGKVSRDRLEESVRRILTMKLQAGLFGPAPVWVEPNAAETIGSPANQALADNIRAVARSRRE